MYIYFFAKHQAFLVMRDSEAIHSMGKQQYRSSLSLTHSCAQLIFTSYKNKRHMRELNNNKAEVCKSLIRKKIEIGNLS